MYGGKLMFGQHDDQQQQDDNNTPVVSVSSDAELTNKALETAYSPEPVTTSSPLQVPDTDGLLNIKQEALSQLSPLVSHLDQNPEERFRTLMMMIQASDNQALIKTAYEAASQISDEKEKAQALLDIVNEINYFTHPQTNDK